MKITYSGAFIEQALVKVFSRGDRTIRSVAEDLNVSFHTLKNWMKRKSMGKLSISVTKEKRPQDWSAEEQLVALHETHGLSGETLHAWCREKGLFAHHLASWKTAFCTEVKAVQGIREFRTLKDENEKLKRELVRKEKALAEAAALLILQKKFPRALGGRGQMTSLAERGQVMTLVAEAIAAGAHQDRACAAISLSERTLQRWQLDPLRGDQRPMRLQAPKNKLSVPERERLLAVVNSDEFGDLPPGQIVPRLADRGQYIASESTIYRALREAHQLRHRGAERPAQQRHKPRALCATAPNALFSWDITYLPTQVKGIYFYLYLFMDIFSRKIVGWQIYDAESSDLASEVMRDICKRENIALNQVVLHSDNGSPMKGATMLATLQALGVMPSFSRPAVSNDNPFSESLFKTLKYRPVYPFRPFESLIAARQWVSTFVHWYNHEHRHSAIRFVTPAERHAGLDTALLQKRVDVYEAAKKRHPERWSGVTRNWRPVRVVHLNPDQQVAEKTDPKEENLELKKAA
ncbi:MAG: IS3 family transposase [Gammaproteobacteria bacterium]